MKDFNGNELFVGQKIVVVTGHYKEFHRCTVLGFTPKKVKIGPSGSNIDPHQCLVYEWKYNHEK